MNHKLIHFFFVLVLLSQNVFAQDTTQSIDIKVYRSQSCSCCRKWQEHLKQNNFNVDSLVTDNLETIKQQHGVPEQLASCHTAVVDGYVVEGHVPANDIKRLVAERPQISGITAPGMPIGSPGMESGDMQQSYQVKSYDKQGDIQVFAEH